MLPLPPALLLDQKEESKMSNMSYCRFQNTLHDLRDCEGALENEEALSDDEARAAQHLIEACQRIVEMYPEGYKAPDGEKLTCQECGHKQHYRGGCEECGASASKVYL